MDDIRKKMTDFLMNAGNAIKNEFKFDPVSNKVVSPAPTITNEQQRQIRLKYAKQGFTRPDMTDEEKAVAPIIPTPTPPPDENAMPYYKIINEEAKKNNIPQDILYNVLRKESIYFNPDVISGALSSPAGAKGIAQFMPETAEGMGFNPLDPIIAIQKAAEYLAAKKKRHGSWENTLAAYNSGSGNVEKYGGVPPFDETQNYVKSIMANSKLK